MKRLALMAVLALGGLVAVTPLTHAQDGTNAPSRRERGPGGPGGRGGGDFMKQRVERLSTELNLTADQKSKVETIYKESGDKMKALREDTTTPAEDKRAKMRTIMEESNTKVKGVLTEEQKKKFEKMNQEDINRFRGGRGPGGPGAPGQGAGEKKDDKK